MQMGEILAYMKFLSTPSARRATNYEYSLEYGENISIHALREEGDAECRLDDGIIYISIHALREEGDSWPVRFSLRGKKFLSTPSARRATRIAEILWTCSM